MNKKLNRGLAIIIPDKKVNTFIMFIIILGIISGSLFLVVLKDTDFSNNFNFTFSNIEGAEGLTSGTVKVYLSYTYEVESEISETTGESEEATAKPTVETKTITFDKVQQ